MPVSKRLLFCATFLLASGNDILASTEIFLAHAPRRSLHMGLQRAYKTFSTNFIATRCYSGTNDRNSFEDIPNHRRLMKQNDLSLSYIDLRRALDTLEKRESLFIQCCQMFEEIKRSMTALRQEDDNQIEGVFHDNSRIGVSSENLPIRNVKQKPQLKLAVITPINNGHRDTLSFHTHDQDFLLLSVPENVEESRECPKLKEFSVPQKTQEKAVRYQELSEAPARMRNDFVNRIMQAAKNAHKIISQDLIAILDLYTVLIRFNKEGITKVLTGQTISHQSNIYSAVVRQATSKQSTLSAYREAYTRLCEGFGEEGMQIIYKVITEMMNEQRNEIKRFKQQNRDHMERQEYISMIVMGANPLYPVHPEEVEQIMDLYAALSSWRKDGITKVLSGQTNTHQSNIYSAVVRQATSKQSTLNVYRNIYARISHSLEGKSIIVPSFNNTINTKTGHGETTTFNKIQTNTDVDQGLLSKEDQYCASQSKSIQTPQNQPSVIHTKTDFTDETLKMKSGKYTISKKEKERLNRIYTLLPEFDAKSITKALSGTTKNNNLPIWKALSEAIDQIKREAEREGDTTPINLKYFQKLYWSAVRVTGEGGSRKEQSVVEREVRDLVSKKKKQDLRGKNKQERGNNKQKSGKNKQECGNNKQKSAK